MLASPTISEIEVTTAPRRPYDVEIVPEFVDGNVIFVARHPELRGCMSHGATPEEAMENLDEARALYLGALRQRGIDAPPEKARPRAAIVIPVPTGTVHKESEFGRQSPWRTRVEL
jgi:predicted RNase H-like HicB family nuclease